MRNSILRICSKIFMLLQNKFPKIFFIYLLLNELLIKLAHGRKLTQVRHFQKDVETRGVKLQLRALTMKDFDILDDLLNRKLSERSKNLFTPHARDENTLKRVLSWSSLLPCGLFQDGDIVGYIILRIFFPNKTTMATLVSDKYQGRGFGSLLNKERLSLTRSLGFRGFSSVTKTNESSMKATIKSGGHITCEIGDVVIFTYD